ncbi:MAG TPA: hypothetical protein VKG79_09515, partial [Bryobacteraceae bacterium]|nr:hypothetical protein [Bryobacteraceae bacterium]
MPAALSEERAQRDDPAAWMRRLADLDDVDARRDFFSSDAGAHRLDTAERFHAEVLRLAYVDVQRAARLAEATEWLAALLDHPV